MIGASSIECPDGGDRRASDNGVMIDVDTLTAKDLKGLSKGAMSELATTLLAQLSAQRAALEAKDAHIARRDRDIKFKDAKIERITFELARLKC